MSDINLRAEQWREISRRIFCAWGAPEDIADCVARSLVDSDLAGIYSHGVIRVADYISYVKAGLVASGVPAGDRTRDARHHNGGWALRFRSACGAPGPGHLYPEGKGNRDRGREHPPLRTHRPAWGNTQRKRHVREWSP